MSEMKKREETKEVAASNIALIKGREQKERRRTLIALSFIAPNFIGFAVFTLIPVIFAFVLAFTKWDGSNPIQFAGIANFTKLFSDQFFLAALKNTIIYCIDRKSVV